MRVLPEVANDDGPLQTLLSLDQHLGRLERDLGLVRSRYESILRAVQPALPQVPLPSTWSGRLSAQECRVRLLVLDGKTNQEVADALHVSVNTIRTQLKSVYRKLGVHSRWRL